MRGYLLALCSVVLAANLAAKALTSFLPATGSPQEHPPPASIQFQAATGRKWLQENRSHLNRAVLSRSESSRYDRARDSRFKDRPDAAASRL